MKKNSGLLFFILIPVLIVVLIIISATSHTQTVKKTITSEEEMAELMATAAVAGKRTVRFETTLEPQEAIFNTAFDKAVSKDPYMASELHHYTYAYVVSGSVYKVKLKLGKPSATKSFFTKIRVKQIAKRFNKLDSDYEKIKATHDYLARLNKYSNIYGGAFRCLYFGQSACNGYAYSFYLIMKEMGIPATCEFGGNHEWNTVFLDGYWYNIDVTWDDIAQNVSYDYFLKCDKDWLGHNHGSSNASKSITVTGMDARYYYRMIPNYRLIRNVLLVVFIVGMVFLIRILAKVMNKRELKQIQQRLELEEQAKRMFQEEIQRKREAFGNEDHNLW